MTEKFTKFVATPGSIRLQQAASTDDFREQLRGVYFDPERKVAVATDGHMVAVRKADDREPFGQNIRFDKLDQLSPASERGDAYEFEVAANEAGVLRGHAEEVKGKGSAHIIEPENGRGFPDYASVVPREQKNQFVVSLDARLLYRLAKAIHDDKWLKIVTLSFDTENPREPIVVQGDSGCGVLMPCRLDDGVDPLRKIQELISPAKAPSEEEAPTPK